jgi:hypothetical protein
MGHGTYSQEIKLDLVIHVNYHQLLYHDVRGRKKVEWVHTVDDLRNDILGYTVYVDTYHQHLNFIPS